MTASADNRELFRRARQLAGAGRSGEAEALFRRILDSEPGHVDALAFLGMGAFQRGDYGASEQWLRRALEVRPADAVLRQNLGLVHKARGETGDALRELDAALAERPAMPMAHLHRGELLCQAGRDRDAADALARAVALNPNLADRRRLDEAPEQVKRLVRRLEAARDRMQAQARREALDGLAERFGESAMARARDFLAIFNGKREAAWDHPLQTPSWMFVPGLEPRPWYERDEFDWVARAEGAAPRIREELRSVLSDGSDIQPYVPGDGPMHGDWRKLAGTTNWGSYHFYRGGVRQDEHCRACPETAALLESLPLMDAPGHAPEAFFSILRPGAHIPPHVGLANTKLAVHLALVIPPDCSITVGGETRGWTENEIIVFDDSFEHEARNASDDVRAVLITEIWNPQLTEAERESVRAVIAVGEELHRRWQSVARDIRQRVG